MVLIFNSIEDGVGFGDRVIIRVSDTIAAKIMHEEGIIACLRDALTRFEGVLDREMRENFRTIDSALGFFFTCTCICVEIVSV